VITNLKQEGVLALSRLSPYNINEDLLRAQLYREIRDGQESSEWRLYEVQPSDTLRPELIAYKVYGTREMKWLILVAAGLDDMREELEAATVLRLPEPAWVRQRIKHYVDIEAKART
jgi:hypothetical protein